MENLNDNFDKKISSRFKEVFDKQEFECNEADWQKMKDLLDRELPECEGKHRGFRFSLLIFVLLFSFLGKDCRNNYFLSDNKVDNSTKASFAADMNTAQTLVLTGKTADWQAEKGIQEVQNVTTSASKAGVTPSIASAKLSFPAGKNAQKTFISAKKTFLKPFKNIANEENLALPLLSEEEKKANMNAISEENKTDAKKIDRDNLPLDSLKQHFTLLPTDSAKAEEIKPLTFFAAMRKNEKYLRLGVSYATIRNGDFKPFQDMTVWSTGHEFSVLADWIVSRDLSLQTGVSWFYFKKVFLSNGEFWSFYNQLPAGGQVPLPSKEVSLNILNIPLDVRVNVLNAPRSSVYVSLGISNYLFLSEYYKNYTEEVIKSAKENEPSLTIKLNNVEDRSRAFEKFQFGTALNFAVGVEKLISDKISVQIEPFYRKPLGNPQQERVYFHTLGARLRINFLPTFKKI